MSDRKEIKQLVARIERIGWPVDRRPSGHFQIRPPEGPLIHFGAHGTDWRAVKNIEAQLKRAGFFEAEDAFNKANPAVPAAPEVEEEKEEIVQIEKKTNGNGTTTVNLTTSALSAGPMEEIDQHVLGLVRLGRQLDRLDMTKEQMESLLHILQSADDLGLTLKDIRHAIAFSE